MKYFCTVFYLLCSILLHAQPLQSVTVKLSPLASYSDEWNKPVYAACNTAEKVTYMNTREKEVIYILNLVRTYPQLFASSVLLKYPERSENYYLLNDTFYFRSLLNSLLVLRQEVLLVPDKKCYESAQCHALQSGTTGYIGHERMKSDCLKKQYFSAECCDYEHNDALEIVLSLLIDEGVPSLGHRSACLGDYEKLGVSIQMHKVWKYNAVLDFQY